MRLLLLFFFLSISATLSFANTNQEKSKIERAVHDYIESQHNVDPEMMKRGIDSQLVKRTYWSSKDNTEFVKESDYQKMVRLSALYNKNGDKFPTSPKVEVKVFDIDQRVASVKLITDDWIDYMHLYKTSEGKWKILNVLWQYHDISTHAPKKANKSIQPTAKASAD